MPDDNYPIAVPVEHTERTTTPATPAAGQLLVYPKTDHKLYKLDSTGAESEVGGGSASKSFAFFV